MTEKVYPSKRSQDKKRPNRRGSGKGKSGRYFALWVFGGVFIVIAIIVGVLVFSPSNTAPPTDPLDKSQGPATAKVVVTEYGDFQCPACKQFALEIAPKIKTDFVDTGMIRFRFRQMAFIGDESKLASEASECANDQGRFWDYYEKLYQNQGGENTGTYTNASLAGYAQDLKLDMTKFNACLTSHKYKAKVTQETTTGENSGITSTPSVMINDKLADWGGDYTQLQTLIQQAVQNAH
jgi:protein-disulfide isomerase